LTTSRRRTNCSTTTRRRRDRVVIDTRVAKYGDALSLYRQSAILER
jgi:hypothetical protein